MEMIQMLEGLNLHGLGAAPRRIRERFDPWRRMPRPTPISIAPGPMRMRWPPPPPPPLYPPLGAREVGDGGPPLGAMDTTVSSILKFGAITVAAGGALYFGAKLLKSRRSSRRRRR